MTGQLQVEMKEGSREGTKDLFGRLLDELAQRQVNQSPGADSFEEFWRQSMVGDCPFCGSDRTMDCGDTFIDDNTLGVCFDCHKMWCLECGEVLQEGQKSCGHWGVCEKCESGKAADGCGIPIWECPIIEDWKKSLTGH